MQLSKNETYIAWGLGLALGLGVVLYGGKTWLDTRNGLKAQHDKLVTQQSEDKKSLDQGRLAKSEFDKLRIQTLDARRDIAVTNRLIQSVFNEGGLTFTAWNAAGQLREIQGHRDFLETRYTGTAMTTTARLARFLQYLSTLNMPARIDVIDITAPKPGVDQLRVVFTISALLYQPAPTGRGGTSTRPAATTPVTRSGSATTTTSPAATRGGNAVPSPVSGMAPTDVSRIEAELAKKREQEAADLAAASTRPKKTPEQIEAELEARRSQEDTSLGTQPGTRPATTPGGTQ